MEEIHPCQTNMYRKNGQRKEDDREEDNLGKKDNQSKVCGRSRNPGQSYGWEGKLNGSNASRNREFLKLKEV